MIYKNMYSTSVKKGDFHSDTISFFENKNVLVTGGSGFIGSHVVEQLVQLKANPLIISRSSSPKFLNNIKGLKILVGDLNDKEFVSNCIDQSQVVMHLAASVAGIEYNKKHPASIFKDNMEMFMNTIHASALNNNIERFLVTSSACVYPRHCSIPTKEEEGVQGEPEPTNSGYGWSKRMEEYLGKKYSEEYGLKVAIARPYNAYGPRDNFSPDMSHVIPSLIKKAFDTTNNVLNVWGDGSHSRSFLYVDDFARGLIEVTSRYGCSDAINIGANEEISIKELALKICDQVNNHKGSNLVPNFDSEGITGQPRRKCDVTKLEKELKFKTNISFDDGLSNTIEWYKKEFVCK